MDTAFQVIGAIIYLVGWIWLLINAFGESILWGILSFCFSPIAFVYGILHWADLKVPTIMMAAGFVLSAIGGALGAR